MIRADSSCGYLFHAYNNKEIDYGTISLASALLIKKNLRINQTAIVTSDDTIKIMKQLHGEKLIKKAFDHVIITDKDYQVSNRQFQDTRYASTIQPYFNTKRFDSFLLTPFDETILIDADYLILDRTLDLVWGTTEPLMINKSVIDLNHRGNQSGFDRRFNELGIPLYWATVVYFQKETLTKTMFDLMKFIKENYSYYQTLYDFTDNGYYRNDYSISIALHMLNGQLENELIASLPIEDLLVATEFDDMIDFQRNQAIFLGESTQGDYRLYRVNTNVHVMNKKSLLRMSPKVISYAISC